MALATGLSVVAPFNTSTAGAQGDPATFILRNLAGGAIGSIGARTMGLIISQFGKGDELQGQIAAISAQLNQLNSSIINLSDQIAQLNETVKQVACDTNSNSVSDIVSRSQHALGLLEGLTKEPVSNPAGRQALSAEINREVAMLTSAQQGLNNGLMGSGSGQGVLLACARAMQAQNAPFLLTHELRPKVANLVQFYRKIEAGLLLLRVNYFSDQKLPQSYIDAQVKQADDWINQQQAFVKPTLFSGLHAFIDTRTGMIWTRAIHQIDAYNYTEVLARSPGRIGNLDGWRIPTLAQVQALYQGSPNPAGPWFINRAGMQFSGVPGRGPRIINNPTGCLWTSTSSSGRPGERGRRYIEGASVVNGASVRTQTYDDVNQNRFSSTVCYQWQARPPIDNWQNNYSYG